MRFTFTVVVQGQGGGWRLHCGQLGEGEVLDHIKRMGTESFREILMENSHLLTCIQLQP